jgi:hypothetical protein
VGHELAAMIAREYPGQRGVTRPNLFRMRQFFEAYPCGKKVSPLVTQLPWNDHPSRSLSPTLVAKYHTLLPSKALLRRKLHELYERLAPEG